MRTWLNLLLVTMTLTGCTAYIPQHSFTPLPFIQYPPEVSSVLPISVSGLDVGSMATCLQEGFPQDVYSCRKGTACENPCWEVHRQSVSASLEGGKIEVRSDYRGKVHAKDPILGTSCNLDPLIVNVRARTRPQVELKEGKWRIIGIETEASVTRPGDLDTQVCFFKLYHAGTKLDEMLSRLEPKVEEAIGKFAHEISIDKVAAYVDGPVVASNDDGSKICWYPRVTGASLGVLSGTALDDVQLTAELSVAPTALITKGECPPPSNGPRPVPLKSAPSDADFEISTEVVSDYELMTAGVKRALAPLRGKWNLRNFRVADARVYQASGRVVVAVTLEGSVKGQVYLWGTAKPNTDTSTIEVKDLHLAPESKAVLSEISEKLSTRVAALITDTTKSGMGLNIQNAVEYQTRTMRNRTYEKGDVIITVKDLRGKFVGARAVPSGVVADVVLTGAASAAVKKKAQSNSRAEPQDCNPGKLPDMCK